MVLMETYMETPWKHPGKEDNFAQALSLSKGGGGSKRTISLPSPLSFGFSNDLHNFTHTAL